LASGPRDSGHLPAGMPLALHALMPSLDHEILVEMFRDRGELARELLRPRIELPAGHFTAEAASIDLSQVTPTEYRADHVIAFRDRDLPDAPTGFVVIVEVQLSIDQRKGRVWAAYIANAATRFLCPAILLVIAPELSVANWAKGPFETGHPGFVLRPVVVSFADVPEHVNPDVARRVPELTILAALAHPTLETATAALDAIQSLPLMQSELYSDAVMEALPEAELLRLESPMIKNYEYKSDWVRNYLAPSNRKAREEGREEGKEEGREEGKEEGREEGRQALVSVALELARSKLGQLVPADEAAIRALDGDAKLTELTIRLGQASSPEQARAAIDQATATQS
jgi:hypothetical protein